jgi:hypothetical protein
MTSIIALNYDWNEEAIAQFYANLYVWRETKTFHWLLQGKPLSVSYERFAQILGLLRRISVGLRSMEERSHLIVRWYLCMTLSMARLSLVLHMV